MTGGTRFSIDSGASRRTSFVLPIMLFRICLFAFILFSISTSSNAAEWSLAQFQHNARSGQDDAPSDINALPQTKDGCLGLETSTAHLNFEVLLQFFHAFWFRSAVALLSGLWVAHRVRLRVLTQRISDRLQSQQLERVRIARELHDTLLQGVGSLTLMVHTAITKVDRDHPIVPFLSSGLKQAEAVIAEGRERVARLRVNVEAGDVLIDELGILGIEMTARSQTRFALMVHGPVRSLKAQVADECRGIAREAIWNAVQHANASTITLVIDFGLRNFILQVVDDGCGIPQHVLTRSGIAGHWGLSGMRERAAAIGGRLEIQARKGTDIVLRVPARFAYNRI